MHNFRVVYPDNNVALPNIQQFTRDGQRLGSTGQLNTIWNDDGEGLINQDWYGILFGAAAAWQPGQSSIEAFEQSYGQVFHGDMSGALDQAQIELMAAHAVLKNQAKSATPPTISSGSIPGRRTARRWRRRCGPLLTICVCTPRRPLP